LIQVAFHQNKKAKLEAMQTNSDDKFVDLGSVVECCDWIDEGCRGGVNLNFVCPKLLWHGHPGNNTSKILACPLQQGDKLQINMHEGGFCMFCSSVVFLG